MKPTVFYVEKEACPELHQHILLHLPRMQEWYEWEGCELVYLPMHQLSNVNWRSTREYLSYQFPVLRNQEFEAVLDTLKEPTYMLVNRLLAQAAFADSRSKAVLLYTSPAFLRAPDPYVILSEYLPGELTVEEFFYQGFTNLWHISGNSPECRPARMVVDQTNYLDSHEEFVLADQQQLPLDVPDQILEEILDPVAQLKMQIDRIQQEGGKAVVLNLMVHLLNHLNPYFQANQRSVLQFLEEYWSRHGVVSSPSRLTIDQHARIFLTDYGNLEVKMPRLSKTIFLFYLWHPEGVAFPFLGDHKQELMQIYSRICNVSNPDQIENSIASLIDPLSNSVHEKVSRANKAFIAVMTESIAKPYLISGERAEPKKISLDRDLVTYDLPVLQACKD